MRKNELQRAEMALLGGVISIPLIITPNLTVDAINIGKASALFILSFMSIFFLVINRLSIIDNRSIVFLGAALAIGLVLPLSMSESNLVQQLYGVWGRSNGLFTHLSSFLIFIWAISLGRRKNYREVIFWLTLVSIPSLSYGFAQSLGWDFVPWKPPQVFGTLGNTNFYGAHTAIIFSMALGIALFARLKRHHLALVAFILVASLYLTWRTGAFQGIVIICVSTAIAIHVSLLRHLSKLVSNLFLLFVAFLGILATLGVIGFGPLSSLLSSELLTFKFRFYFWQAAIKMFISNPVHGVGLDSFGDWYRISRSDAAYFGGDVGETSDSAHNLILDYAATGGIFLLIFGLFFSYLVLSACFRLLYSPDNQGERENNAVFIFGFLAFFIQSMVSPINIGLLAWGFLLGGFIVGRDYKKYRNKDVPHSLDKRLVSKSFILTLASINSLVTLLALAPISKEYRMLSAERSNAINEYAESIQAFPQSAFIYRLGLSTLDDVGAYGISSKLAQSAISKFPRDYYLLSAISNLRAIDSTRRQAILLQLDGIDPPRLVTKS